MSDEGFQKAHRLLASGQYQAAQALFESLQADSPADAVNGMGICAEAVGDLGAAEASYRQALALNPDEAEFYNNLAICLIHQGRINEGLEVFRSLAERKPEPEVQYNLALALASVGQIWEALDMLKYLLASSPRQASPVFLLLELVEGLASDPGTLDRLRERLAESPDQAIYHLALGAWYDVKGQQSMAVHYFRSALLCNPALIGAYRHLIYQYQARGQYTQALDTARRMFTSEASLSSLVELIISLQHPIPESEAQLLSIRQELIELLDGFTRESPAYLRERELARPSTIPYYQSYQNGDDLPMQRRLAAFFGHFLKGQTLDWQPNPRPRLGIFSVHMRRHSVMDLLLRAVETLLQSGEFETYLFFYPVSQKGQADQLTRELEAKADHFVELPGDFLPASELIAAQNLDLLIYLDIGMDSYSYTLALNRLARYQMVLPGHPVTTGMPSMDYFISAQALEPPDSERFYSEALIQLPGLPDYQRPIPPAPADRAALGLPAGKLYFCPMTIFKILPAFDDLVARILAADSEAVVLMLQYRNRLHLELQARFRRSYPQFSERLQFLPWSEREQFYQRLMAVDAILDTFPFGGGNTAYQAFGLGCPIVCLDVPWQKGRWTQAMYQLMGIDDLIAKSPEHYVGLAVKLANDQPWRQRLRERILQANGVLFDNPSWSEALLDFCRGLAGPKP